ncbi:dTMP kinase [Picosynechococcus sp. PCC 11901]|uniref:dTMP kinase n=1 Tax=Picosynechococcus sp. PCC 11901 TaxID=2579791 RepID=UPI0010FBD040|nr:dTMP kinase [Picosynechococcus sp. PCC 11901]QCS49884.1 dTMP kinase [Picosynechococcus sp. PCC 11901]
MQRKTQAKFIVFEGIDGSGSSTQAELLYQYFQRQKIPAVLSPEPSNGIIGNLVRETLRQRLRFTTDPTQLNRQLAYLFAGDRHDHLYNEIDGVFKQLAAGIQVITTRYYFSSLAYNASNAAEYEFIYRLNQDFPNPDLVFYFDLPVEVALERVQRRSHQEIYETKTKLTQVRQNYQQIFQTYPGNWQQLDATQPPETIHQKILQTIADYFVTAPESGSD